MNPSAQLPDCLKEIHAYMGPLIKERTEAARIRKVLATHLSSCVKERNGQSLSLPLSLLSASSNVEATSAGIRGIRREYLRSAKANVKAQKEYDIALREYQTLRSFEMYEVKGRSQIANSSSDHSAKCIGPFVELVQSRRKHDRLRILQNYLDTASRKPAAEATHFNPESVLKDVKKLPKIPREVLEIPSSHAASDGTDLNALVSRLEKSVLSAKLLLRKEQKLLAKVHSSNGSMPAVAGGSKLEALGTTRNELISWIETELGKANDGPEEDCTGKQELDNDGRGDNDLIEKQLVSIQRQYSMYIKVREALARTSTEKLDNPKPEGSDSSGDDDMSANISVATQVNTLDHVAQPYLEELVGIANEQKAILQQKLHLTTSLAKQLKESNQGLDLLAEESHLLPAYPLSADKKDPRSFADAVSSVDKPDSSRRAREWMFASFTAGETVKNTVSEKLEEGESAVADSREALAALEELVGLQTKDGADASGDKVEQVNIWELLDGRLGAIKVYD
ncbi:hypothetical protein BJ878DRAFT_337961 [Calycina marina]|uniref:Uncharacterized protein n=1 Tax=Calycina marina TaxID=1763456 RepID=A0A9P7Z5L2_9HELO|nr:hypothetical protein BJ878DRAFT_337961 [Calycina marina]